MTPGQSLPIPEEHPGGTRREKWGKGCHHHQWAAHSVRGALQTGAGTCVEDHRNFEPMATLQKTKPQSPHLNLRHGPTVVTKCCMRRMSSQHGKGHTMANMPRPLPGHRSPLLHSSPHSVGRIHLGFSPLYPYLQAAIASSSLFWSKCGAGRMAKEASSLHRYKGPDSQGLGPAPPRPVLCWENVGLCQSTCLISKGNCSWRAALSPRVTRAHLHTCTTFHRIDRGLVCSSLGTQDRTEEHAERPDVYVGEAFSRDGSQRPQPGRGTALTAQDTVRVTLLVSGSPGAHAHT